MFLKIVGLIGVLFMANFKSNVTNDLFTIKQAASHDNVVFVDESKAQIIDNDYERDDVFVCDIIVDKEHGYDIDNTAQTSATQVLQKAIDDCANLGGGTVYLPAGKYLITSRVEIKPYVNLRGDYRNPNNVSDGDYGTIIVSGLPTSEEEVGQDVNLFRMAGSSALIGLTFYYPMQYMDNVVPYGYAIEIPGGITTDYHNVFTIKDVTFLNAYRGICASITPSGITKSVTHEQLHLENVRCTILREGMHLTNSSEVGAFNTIDLSPKYWANAGKEFNAPDIRNIIDYTSKNSVGLILGDLEWQEIENVNIENYHTGIYFHNKTRVVDYKMAFIGSLYNINISDATYGVYVESLYPNLGIEFANSTIEGSKYAIINNSNENEGHLKLSGVTLNGAIGGVNIYYNNQLNGEIKGIGQAKLTYNLPKLNLFNVMSYNADNSGKTDTSSAIQNALDDAKNNGGGVVYLPAGFYRLEKPLKVYANTQLRGCTNAVQKDLQGNSLGTLILAYYGNVSRNENEPLITLEGDNAGVSGLRVVYPEINLFKEVITKDTLPVYSYTIKGNGDGVYATNLYLTGVYDGIDFSNNCNDYLIRRVMGVFYHNGFKLGGNNGVVDTCLSNGIAITKVGSNLIDDFDEWVFDVNDLANVLNTYVYSLTRQSTHFIILENARNAKIHNLFTYASNSLIDAYNSDFEGLNLGLDSQPNNSGNMFFLNDSSGYVFNTLRDALGTESTYMTLNGNSSLTVYNRITLLPNNASKTETNIVDNETRPLAHMSGDSEIIDKIWEQEVDYEYIDYGNSQDSSSSQETPIDPNEPTTPSDNNNNYMWIGIGIGAGVLIIALIIVLIIKFRR